MPRPRKYPEELIQRGVRLVLESGRPISHIARDIGLPPETLRKRVRQVEADEGLRPDLPTSEEREEIKALRKEVFELRRANEILKAASVFFATELDADRPR
jgi:transposase